MGQDKEKQVLVFGLRHQRAPIAIREKLAFEPGEIPAVLRRLLQQHQASSGIEEAIVLSTCNRIEIYAAVRDADVAVSAIKTFLGQYKHIDPATFQPYSFVLLRDDAVVHLFKVASGIDSLILGEDQIMAQVKEALKLGTVAQSSGLLLDKVFQSALTVGKAVRTETGIATRDINIAKAAFEFTQEHHSQFLKRPMAVIGGGKMAEILLGCLHSALPLPTSTTKDVPMVTVLNRTQARAEELATQFGFQGLGWECLEQAVARSETIFVATGSPHFILTSKHLHQAPRPKVLMDISVPRNIDPVVGQYNGISLYNTDDLAGYSGYTGENRVRLIAQANDIIAREFRNFQEWQVGRLVAPLITQLRQQFELIRRRELTAIVSENPDLKASMPALEALTKSLLNKFLHHPTVQIKSGAAADVSREVLQQQMALLERLFQLSSDPEHSELLDTAGRALSASRHRMMEPRGDRPVANLTAVPSSSANSNNSNVVPLSVAQS
jgi:glutamyl-tRNA reductase